jgi:hypothetical protein
MPDILPTSALVDPSHSGEHNRTNTNIAVLRRDMDAQMLTSDAHSLAIDAARMVTEIWTVPGALVTPPSPPLLLLPVIWNLTDQQSVYVAAKATVFVAPQGQPILVDIVAGPTLVGGVYDPGNMRSILKTPMVIPPGNNSSITYYADLAHGDFFTTTLPINNFVGVTVNQVGLDPEFGSDLIVQLNRKL